MVEFLMRLTPWGVDVIVAIQSSLGSNLDSLFRAITLLGDATVYVAVVLALLWQDETGRVRRLAVLLLLSVLMNELLKAAIAIPRPFVISSAVQAKATAFGYSFPSGHAQGSTVLWLGTAAVYRRRWPLLVGAVLIPLVSFSRVYLGVHYPEDVIGGIVVGATLVGLFALCAPPFARRWERLTVGPRIAVCVLLPLALAAIAPNDDARLVAGGLMGLILGHTLAGRWLGPVKPAPGRRAVALRAIIGLAATGVVFVAPVALSLTLLRGWAPPPPVLVLQAAAAGATISLGAPWLFTRSGLSARAND